MDTPGRCLSASMAEHQNGITDRDEGEGQHAPGNHSRLCDNQ